MTTDPAPKTNSICPMPFAGGDWHNPILEGKRRTRSNDLAPMILLPGKKTFKIAYHHSCDLSNAIGRVFQRG